MIARLSNGAGEIWRGALRQFYRDNAMHRADARRIHTEIRQHGNAQLGGGATGDFTLELVRAS